MTWIKENENQDFNYYSNKKYQKRKKNRNGTYNTTNFHISEHKNKPDKTHVTFHVFIIKPNDVINEKYYYYPYTNSFTFDQETPVGKKLTKMLINVWRDFIKKQK